MEGMFMRATVTEVFTPATVARLAFVEREILNKRLVNALRTPGKQIVVYGRSGGGKTTLLENKLHQTYERHIKSQCTASTTFEQLLLNALDQLEPFFTDTKGVSRTTTTSMTLEGKAALSRVTEIRAELGRSLELSSASTQRRALPPQLNPTLLAQLLGAAHACWVVEDLHKMPLDERKHVAQAMKLFMDAADQSPDVRIVVIGAVGSARDVVVLDSEMWNRVSEIEVDLMSAEEITEIMNLGEKHLNIKFTPEVKSEIVHYANGLPAVCHQLCLNLCDDANIHETCSDTHTFTSDALARALTTWIADATDSLRRLYDVATKTERARQYDNCRLIIHALSKLPKDGGTHAQLLQKIREQKPNYPSSNLSNYLTELQAPKRGEVVIHDVSSGRYYFGSPMLHAYARAMSREEVASSARPSKPLTGQDFIVNFAKVLSETAGVKNDRLLLYLSHYEKDRSRNF
jgi:hypothetical protein